MQQTALAIPGVLTTVLLIGCGSGDGARDGAPPFIGGLPPGSDTSSVADPSTTPTMDVPAGGNGGDVDVVAPELDGDPMAAPPAEGEAPSAEDPTALPPIDEIPPGNVMRPVGNLSRGFFVADGRLYDRQGADFVMRGINHPVVWFQGSALQWLDEIATTGSNAVRIVWEATAQNPQVLRAAIERAVELGIVPMVELHDETGSNDPTGPALLAEYYISEVRDILDEFEPYLLVNIANEWGDFSTTGEQWLEAYRLAIDTLRDAGVNHTLVIDANDWGQRGRTIVDNGQALLDYDPQHNLLFSTHMYQSYENPQVMLDVIRGAESARLPLIVGEFGFQHGSRGGQPIPVPFEVMLEEAERAGIGWLAWSWTGNNQEVGYLDLSVNGSASQLSPWGREVIDGDNGIRATSRPASIFAAP